MKKYRKKPVVIEAIQFTGGNAEEVFKDVPEEFACEDVNGNILIFNDHGEVTARPGDYIVRGIKGGYYPCQPDIFEETYDEEKASGTQS